MLWGLFGLCLCVVTLTSPVAAHADLEEQIARMTLRIGQNPDNATLYLRRGDLHRFHEDWDAAKADYARAGDLDPALDRVNLSVGKLELESGRAGPALVALERFLAMQPGDTEGLVHRGRARAGLGDALGAGADFDHALARSVELGLRPSPEIYLERARVLRAAGAIERALRGLESGSVLLGRPVVLEIEAIALERLLERTDAAVARIDRIAASAVRKESWLVLRGEILEEAGRLDASRQAYAAALESLENRPAHRRNVRALRALEREARAALGRLGAPDLQTQTRVREVAP